MISGLEAARLGLASFLLPTTQLSVIVVLARGPGRSF